MTKIIYKFAAVLLAAALSAVMVSMMWIGGGVSFSDFLNAGRVYDVSQEALCAPSRTFYFLEETGEFLLTSDKKAVKRIKLDGKEQAWKYLYLDIGSMSMDKLEAEIHYYGKKSGLIYVQPVTFTVGENMFELEDGLAVYRLGIFITGAKGERLSLASMQVREKERIDIPEDIWYVFGISFGVVFVLGSVLCLCIRPRKTLSEEKTVPVYLCESLCKAMERLFGDTHTQKRRQNCQRVSFVLLFLSCIVWNVTGWSTDAISFRYCYLVCALLLLAAGFFCREKPLRAISFRAPVPCAWLMLWVWLMISDLWTTASVHYHEYVMAGAAGFFLVLWAQAEDAENVFFLMTDALKAVFFLGILYCLFFRPNDMETPYGGIFEDTEAGVMYALLMLVTFLSGFDRAVEKMPYGRRRFLWEIPGILLSLYLTVRTEEWMGYLLGAVVLLFFIVRVLAAGKKYAFFLWKRLFIFLFSAAAGVLAVEGFHIGTQCIPQAVSAVSDDEEKGVPDDDRYTVSTGAWQYLSEKIADGIVIEERDTDAETIDVYYLRRLSLYGSSTPISVFRSEAMTKNGYLFLAYRYGIFVLLPFVLYQLAVLGTGIAGFWKDRKKLWMLGVILIYIGFSIHGNAELPLSHPLWLCVYLCPGIVMPAKKESLKN